MNLKVYQLKILINFSNFKCKINNVISILFFIHIVYSYFVESRYLEFFIISNYIEIPLKLPLHLIAFCSRYLDIKLIIFLYLKDTNTIFTTVRTENYAVHSVSIYYSAHYCLSSIIKQITDTNLKFNCGNKKKVRMAPYLDIDKCLLKWLKVIVEDRSNIKQTFMTKF